MDEPLRAAERSWRAGDPGALEALVHAHARAGLELPWEVIAALPRWRALTDFAARWCARPLGPVDGLAAEVVRAKEAELGFALPAALREWYRLVGAALRTVHDLPTSLPNLALCPLDVDDEPGPSGVQVFEECHGHYFWVVLHSEMHEDDPPVHGSHDGAPHVKFSDRLSDFLTAMTIKDAGWTDRDDRRCSFGELGASVRAAFLRGGSEPLSIHYARLPLVPLLGGRWMANSRWFGDTDTIIALSGESVIGTAITRTEEACERLRLITGLTVEFY